jgi:hypothetical protein
VIFPSDQITDEDAALDWWDKYADECGAYGVPPTTAALIRTMVASIRAIRSAGMEAPLSLVEAAERSGYTADHLGRLVRSGKIPNVGRKNAPRIRARDLPPKPDKLAEYASDAYSQAASDARSLRVRR